MYKFSLHIKSGLKLYVHQEVRAKQYILRTFYDGQLGISAFTILHVKKFSDSNMLHGGHNEMVDTLLFIFLTTHCCQM